MRRISIALFAGLLGLAMLSTPTPATSHAKFDSGTPFLEAGETFEWTFNDAGTYEYICTPHPFMEGTIVVDPASSLGGAASVTIKDFEFTPATLTVAPGTTVTWTNDGPTAHTATETAESPGPAMAPGGGDGGSSPGFGVIAVLVAALLGLAARASSRSQ